MPRSDNAHDAELLSHVHPATWANPTPKPLYDLVVIGAGTAGLVSAAGAAGLGARVALVERALMGGDCLNHGCVPSKALIASARTTWTRRSPGLETDQSADEAADNFSSAMERMRALRAKIAPHDSAARFAGLGVDVFFGDARFNSPESIGVAGATLRFKRAVIATGAHATHLDIPGLAESGFLTNETVFDLAELPRRMAIIGGGPIGVELGQTFQRLGAQVSIIEQSDRLMPSEDEDISKVLHASLGADGVRLHLASNIVRVLPGAPKGILLQSGEDTQTIETDAILVALGRQPNVEGLGLQSAGIESRPNTGIVIDDFFRTANPRVFACGDCCMQHKFTHAADFAARAVIQNAFFLGRKRQSALHIPWCTYSQPEVARIGLSERDAEAQGIAVDVFRVPMSGVDRAILDGETGGMVKILTRRGSGSIVGATIVSPHAGESIGEIAMAMTHGISLGQIANVIHPYPTQAEAIRRAGDLFNRTRLTPRVAAILRGLIRLRR